MGCWVNHGIYSLFHVSRALQIASRAIYRIANPMDSVTL